VHFFYDREGDTTWYDLIAEIKHPEKAIYAPLFIDMTMGMGTDVKIINRIPDNVVLSETEMKRFNGLIWALECACFPVAKPKIEPEIIYFEKIIYLVNNTLVIVHEGRTYDVLGKGYIGDVWIGYITEDSFFQITKRVAEGSQFTPLQLRIWEFSNTTVPNVYYNDASYPIIRSQFNPRDNEMWEGHIIDDKFLPTQYLGKMNYHMKLLKMPDDYLYVKYDNNLCALVDGDGNEFEYWDGYITPLKTFIPIEYAGPGMSVSAYDSSVNGGKYIRVNMITDYEDSACQIVLKDIKYEIGENLWDNIPPEGLCPDELRNFWQLVGLYFS